MVESSELRVSTIGALGVNGILTALCYEATLNANLFEDFVEHFLVPVLTPNQIVILDNALSHHSEKVKNFLKQTVISSTTEELYQAISAALETVTPDEAPNCINHCL